MAIKFECWNVNGYRAVLGKGFKKWFEDQEADVVSLQEVKAFAEQINPNDIDFKGYERFWNAAKKPGYSGTATWIKSSLAKKIEDYKPGFGIEEYDQEGRTQIFEFKDFYYLAAYFPNSQAERARLKYKLGFCDEVQKFVKKAHKKGKPVILCGDWNIAPTEIDLKNPKSNEDSPGYYQEERDWMSQFLTKTSVQDVFRNKHPQEPSHYTWWSYRSNARANNVGWRIDYHIISDELADRVKEVSISHQTLGSDHCPVELVLKS